VYFIDDSAGRLRMWSQSRMPLQPVGPMLEARARIAAVLRRNDAPSEAILSCTYSSMIAGPFDVENVLVYNIGTGAFARPSKNGLSVKRLWDYPSTAPDGKQYQHFCEYRFRSAPIDLSGIVEFEFPPTSFASIFDVWWSATPHVPASRPHGGAYGLLIKLGLPRPLMNPGHSLKKIVDGIVVALQVDPFPESLAVDRLAAKHHVDRQAIVDRLTIGGKIFSLAPGRRSVLPYRDHVQWVPADQLCEECTLLVKVSDLPTCNVVVYELNR
jgi:hypothetical protein